MSLDLVKKLVALANNNPHEHEANLAARKACKLIADLKLLEQATRGNPINKDNYRQWEPVYKKDPYQAGAEERARRAAEAREREVKERTRREKEAEEKIKGMHYDSVFYDEVSNIDFNRPPFSDFYRGVDFGAKEYVFTGRRGGKTAQQKRMLNCRTCKNSKLTAFVGAPEMFECNTCQWTAYQKEKKK